MSITLGGDKPKKSGSTDDNKPTSDDNKPTSLVKIIKHTLNPKPAEHSEQPIHWMGKMEREKE